MLLLLLLLGEVRRNDARGQRVELQYATAITSCAERVITLEGVGKTCS